MAVTQSAFFFPLLRFQEAEAPSLSFRRTEAVGAIGSWRIFDILAAAHANQEDKKNSDAIVSIGTYPKTKLCPVIGWPEPLSNIARRKNRRGHRPQ
jgi:hypothetical protein